MTLYNLIKQSELSSDRYHRDAKIMDVFGLKELDLTSIRLEGRVVDRVFTGAEILIKRLKEKGIDSTIIPAQLTIGNLALLIDDGSYYLSPPNKLVGTALKRYYRKEKESVKKETGLYPTYTQLLREELGIYQGNLYTAKRAWPELKVSEFDWLKDVRIPISIGMEEAILLGIYYARGTITPIQDRNNSKIEIFGRNYDFEFYEKIVKPLLKKVHNIIPSTPSDERFKKWREGNVQGYTYNVPSFIIDSLALVSWLQNEIGMPISRDEDRKIPEFGSLEQKLGFFKGTVAADASLNIDSERSRMLISGNSSYISGLKKISEDLRLSPTMREGNTLLDYDKGAILQMIRMGVFVNPYHIEKTYDIGIEIIEPRKIKGKLSAEDLKLLAFLYNCNVPKTAIFEHFSLSLKTNISYYLNLAEKRGFRVIRREDIPFPPHLVRDTNEVLNFYKKVIEHHKTE